METIKQTRTRTKPAPSPLAPILSPQEQWQKDYDYWMPFVERELQRVIERDAEARAEFVGKIQAGGTGALAYQVAWSEGTVQASYEAVIATGIISHMEDGESQPTPRGRLYAACKHYRDDLTRSLLGDRYRQSSTGYFHRACEGAERAAAKTMREKLDWYCTMHDDVEKLGASLGA